MESAKECVTTHLPKQVTLKMAWRLSTFPILDRRRQYRHCHKGGLDAPVSRRSAVVSVEGFGVSRSGAATGADLGGSSKYSSEITLVDRSGEGFRANIAWSWVSRP